MDKYNKVVLIPNVIFYKGSYYFYFKNNHYKEIFLLLKEEKVFDVFSNYDDAMDCLSMQILENNDEENYSKYLVVNLNSDDIIMFPFILKLVSSGNTDKLISIIYKNLLPNFSYN